MVAWLVPLSALNKVDVMAVWLDRKLAASMAVTMVLYEVVEKACKVVEK